MALVSLWFGIVYAGSDWLTARRAFHLRVDLSLESHLPLIPAFIVVYMSIYALFLAAPFVLRTQSEIQALAITQTIVILIGGIGFLLIPATLAFVTPDDLQLGAWKGLFRFADRLNLDYNLVPSLHVALSISCLEFFALHTTASGRILLRLWGLLIALSTLFTHQHHLLDAVTGYLIALAVVQFSRWRAASKKALLPLKL
jgi:membrane-associated phospholipid phosphatase